MTTVLCVVSTVGGGVVATVGGGIEATVHALARLARLCRLCSEFNIVDLTVKDFQFVLKELL